MCPLFGLGNPKTKLQQQLSYKKFEAKVLMASAIGIAAHCISFWGFPQGMPFVVVGLSQMYAAAPWGLRGSKPSLQEAHSRWAIGH